MGSGWLLVAIEDGHIYIEVEVRCVLAIEDGHICIKMAVKSIFDATHPRYCRAFMRGIEVCLRLLAEYCMDIWG